MKKSKMKKKIKIAIILIILLVSFVFLLGTGYINRLIATSDDGVVSDVGAISGDDCDYIIRVDLDFIYTIPSTKKLSDYKFPDDTQKYDMLFIKEFRIRNVGNCDILFPFEVSPKLYFDLDELKEVNTFCYNTPILIDNLSLGKDYYSETEGLPYKWNNYSGSPDSFRSCGGFPLEKEGLYVIRTTIEPTLPFNGSLASSVNYISVDHSSGSDISFWIRDSDYLMTQKLAKYGFYLSIATLVLVFVSIIFSFIGNIHISDEEAKKSDKRFDDLFEIQNEILEENRTTNNELAKLNKNLSKETKSAKKK